MLLELLSAPCASFVTLTYADQLLMNGLVLQKRHVQNFLKLLRYYAPGREIRYFAVGEYGEKSWRAHYHLVLFGVSVAESSLLQKAWDWGFVHVGTVTPSSVEYVCGYVTKKLTGNKDNMSESVKKILCGRPPEFALMSRRPGLGTKAVGRFVSAIQSHQGAAVSQTASLIPLTFKFEKKRFPMDRFVKGKYFSGLGLTTEQVEDVKRFIGKRQFDLVVSLGSKEYSRRRKSQVAAESGRINSKRRSL